MTFSSQIRKVKAAWIIGSVAFFASVIAIAGVLLQDTLFETDQAFAAGTLDIAYSAPNTGTAPFDTTQTCDTTSPGSSITYEAGEDACGEDSVIRTNDTVTFEWNFSINGGSDTNLTITQTLPAEMKWEVLPPQCAGPGSEISGDGLTITCNYRDVVNDATNPEVSSGTTVVLPVQAVIRGGTANGTILNYTPPSIVADNSPSVQASEVIEHVVSAAPKYQLEKFRALSFNPYNGPNGEPGWVGEYAVMIYGEDFGKGLESLEDTFTFTDDLSQYTENTELISWGTITQSCATGAPFWLRGKLNVNPINETADSGVVTCNQVDLGTSNNRIDVTVTGADTSANHYPTQRTNGSPLPAGRAYVGAYTLRLWIPQTDVTVAPHNGLRTVTNVITNFDPDSISGASNFLDQTEDLSDNDDTRTFQVTVGGVYDKVWIDVDRSQLPGAGDGSGKSNDTSVAPGYEMAYSVSMRNSGQVILEDVLFCDAIDNRLITVTNTLNSSIKRYLIFVIALSPPGTELLSVNQPSFESLSPH